MKIAPSPICPLSWLSYRCSEKCCLVVCNVNVSSEPGEKKQIAIYQLTAMLQKYELLPCVTRYVAHVSICFFSVYLFGGERYELLLLSAAKTLRPLCDALIIRNTLQLCRYIKQHCLCANWIKMKQSFRAVMCGIRRATANTFRDTTTTNVFVVLDRFHNATPIAVAYSTVRFRIHVQNNTSNVNHIIFTRAWLHVAVCTDHLQATITEVSKQGRRQGSCNVQHSMCFSIYYNVILYATI